MIEHRLFSLDSEESEIVHTELIPILSVAYDLLKQAFGDRVPTTVAEALERVERRYSRENLHSFDEDTEEGRRYGTPQPEEVIRDLQLATVLVIRAQEILSDPEYWERLGLPFAEGLAESRRRSIERIRPLLDRIHESLLEVSS